MTAPAPPPDQQPPPPQGHPIADTVAVAAIAAALASIVGMPNIGHLPSPDRRRIVTASIPGQQITGVLAQQGVPALVAQAVLGMTLSNNPIPHTSRRAPSSDQVRRGMQATNLIRRGQYIQNAARRVADDYRTNVARSSSDISGVDALKARRDALAGALKSERPYWLAHVNAQQTRNKAARAVDDMAAIHGATLGWYALRGDDGELAPNVTRACATADGKNFTVGKPPPIGYPGLGPHVGCRCSSGAPHDTAKTVYDVVPD